MSDGKCAHALVVWFEHEDGKTYSPLEMRCIKSDDKHTTHRTKTGKQWT